jgi:hypothetical protein
MIGSGKVHLHVFEVILRSYIMQQGEQLFLSYVDCIQPCSITD